MIGCGRGKKPKVLFVAVTMTGHSLIDSRQRLQARGTPKKKMKITEYLYDKH